METMLHYIHSQLDKNIKLGIIPGHFATIHSHVNNYIDLTSIKTLHNMAKNAAGLLAQNFSSVTIVDTIVCLEGTEVVGSYLADELSQTGLMTMESNINIAVLTPEYNSNNQMIFRDNTQKMIFGKNILLLFALASTGKTINRSMECLEYYNGKLVGIAALFSAVEEVNNIPVNSIFTQDNIPYYKSYKPSECELCAKKQKIDALVNSFGYSKV